MEQTKTMYRVTRTIWLVFGIIGVLLAFRFALRLLGANPAADFTAFIYGFSAIFVAPFQYVFGTPAVGGSALELSTLLAMAVYWVIAWIIVKAIAMNRPLNQYEAKEGLEREDQNT